MFCDADVKVNVLVVSVWRGVRNVRVKHNVLIAEVGMLAYGRDTLRGFDKVY